MKLKYHLEKDDKKKNNVSYKTEATARKKFRDEERPRRTLGKGRHLFDCSSLHHLRIILASLVYSNMLQPDKNICLRLQILMTITYPGPSCQRVILIHKGLTGRSNILRKKAWNKLHCYFSPVVRR